MFEETKCIQLLFFVSYVSDTTYLSIWLLIALTVFFAGGANAKPYQVAAKVSREKGGKAVKTLPTTDPPPKLRNKLASYASKFPPFPKHAFESSKCWTASH